MKNRLDDATEALEEVCVISMEMLYKAFACLNTTEVEQLSLEGRSFAAD